MNFDARGVHVKSGAVAEGELSGKHDVSGMRCAVKKVTDVNSVAIWGHLAPLTPDPVINS